jgi:hypothetical protein
MVSNRVRSAGAALSLLLLTSPAWPAPSESQKETARTLMAEARELRETRDLAGALSRFQMADAIMGVPTTGYEVAATQAALGQLVEARATLRKLLSAPASPDDPEPFKTARVKAKTLDAELAERVGSLRLQVKGADDSLRISVDGLELEPKAVTEPVQVNPGSHRVVARSAANEQARDVAIAERESVPVSFDFSAETPAASPAAPPVTQEEPGPSQHDAPRPSLPGAKSSVPTLAYVGGGVALAGLIVGSVTGSMALSRKHAAERGCVDHQCPPSTWDDLDSASSLAAVSTASFVVCGVGAAIGIGALLFGEHDTVPSSLTVGVHPRRLDVTGRF